MKLHGVCFHAFPRVALVFHQLGHIAQREVAHAARLAELGPGEWHRYGRALEAAHAVRGHDRLRRTIAEDIDQNLVVALALGNLERARFLVREHEWLRDRARRLEHGIEVPPGFDGRADVESFASGRLHKGVIAELLDFVFQEITVLDDDLPRRTVGRIDVCLLYTS